MKKENQNSYHFSLKEAFYSMVYKDVKVPRVFCSLCSEFLKFQFFRTKHVLFWGHSLVWGQDGALKHEEPAELQPQRRLRTLMRKVKAKKQVEQPHAKQILNSRDKDNTLQRCLKDNVGIGCNFRNPWDCTTPSCLPLMEMMRVVIKWIICVFSYLLLQPHHLP